MAYFEQINLANEDGTIVNPATEESIMLLRRMVKLLESQAATDTAQRQRITVDAITAGTTLPTVTAVTTVGTVSAITAGTITSVGNLASLNGWNQQMFSDPARTAYNTGIRAQLTFT
jgi:hypothetical protein